MKLEDAIKTSKFKGEAHKAILNVLYSAYWLRQHFNQVLKEYGLTLEQFNVMRILNGKHPEQMCVKDIASRIIEKSSNVPRIIDRLTAKGLAVRNPSKEDKRETLISLTASGLELLAICTKAIDEERLQISGVTEEEAVQLNELLEKLRHKNEITDHTATDSTRYF